ncbi:hypothetical protein CPB83DRAFT_231973 [Crepidotus variabilis]|uniref:Btz domain-containing protein n=1 Tax=Crepidotus variabilis TaxID=179855 RepID=A0A9P6ETI5_9AGAR|nr:hypothetical protein CPB83DRAFT_231973 [Crepidotus variabilis]
MPASPAPGRPVGKLTETQKARTVAPTKKRRVTRRRGRARGDLDSDDEIEREAATDESDSENDLSDNSSATDDSDTEPVSEDVITHDRTHLPTPRNSKSPESVGKGDPSSFFAPGASWSEMVDEGANESGDLPVVDFAEFGTKPLPPPKALAKKAKRAAAKAKKRAEVPAPLSEPSKPLDPAPAPTADRAEESSTTATDPKRVPQSSRNPLPGHSARQLYQQKLESDPSYVPTIGNFWSHDDRLIDTELRNLSGWWRGRGGRGRGRGGFAVRGRGAFHGAGGREGENQPTPDENLPPVDKAWTHDGFEEMKKRDEKRRAEQAAVRKAQESPKRGFAGRGGRGGLVSGRGRGGVLRGGFASPVNGRNNSPFNRARFAMKPELMWTKQHEAFLYFDPTMKPRPGQGAGFRIRVPGQEDTQVVRAPPTSASRAVASSLKARPNPVSQEEFVVVRLPIRSGRGKHAFTPATRKEQLGPSISKQPDIGAKSAPVPAIDELSLVSLSPQLVEGLPEPLIVSQIEQLSLEPTLPNPEREAMTEQAVLRDSSNDLASDVPEPNSSIERPVLAPLQTTFTPPPPPPPPQPISQPSPAYGSPYPYSVPLPPGIAMNAHGMPYEMATGRPVYLQPPTTVYNPRPMMHYPHPSMTFHPGHMQHPSLPDASPDFLAQPPSHTPPAANGFIDPATGTPIFSFPRQTTRIEIRAPVGNQATIDSTKSASTQASVPRTPSGLRTTAPTFQPQPTRPIGYYQEPATSTDSAIPSYDPNPPASSTSGHAHSASFDDAAASMSGGVMQPYPGHYPHPHQAYYYPDPYGGYPQYMDMSHAGQTYDAYGMEQTPQGTVYY